MFIYRCPLAGQRAHRSAEGQARDGKRCARALRERSSALRRPRIFKKDSIKRGQPVDNSNGQRPLTNWVRPHDSRRPGVQIPLGPYILWAIDYFDFLAQMPLILPAFLSKKRFVNPPGSIYQDIDYFISWCECILFCPFLSIL